MLWLHCQMSSYGVCRGSCEAIYGHFSDTCDWFRSWRSVMFKLPWIPNARSHPVEAVSWSNVICCWKSSHTLFPFVCIFFFKEQHPLYCGMKSFSGLRKFQHDNPLDPCLFGLTTLTTLLHLVGDVHHVIYCMLALKPGVRIMWHVTRVQSVLSVAGDLRVQLKCKMWAALS